MRTRSLYMRVYKSLFPPERGFFVPFEQEDPKCPKNAIFVKCVISVLYKKSDIFLHFFCNKIWSIQKKAVLLHPLSPKKRVIPKKARAMIFEKMSIITRCSTRTE